MSNDDYAAGVRAGVEAFVRYFQDENEYSILSDFNSRALEETVEFAFLDALNDRSLYV